ncbi:ATP-grasp domain-containing protein [Paracoccus sp. S4493]|uniref:ATP-grasp domain-containing protein n=1 Tax=Paracoccus sp. S4493 TaxID=579490 RepID=UPI00138E333A|nr:ATP-grasp domain-containing protein [Paracoccus sp. S4493]
MVDKVRSLGFRVAQFLPPVDAPDFTYQTSYSVYITDYENEDSYLHVVASLAEKQDIVGVVSLSEAGMLPASRSAERLGLRFAAVDQVVVSRDKYMMREKLRSELGHSIKYTRAYNNDDVHRFIEVAGYPVIAKPIDGVASENVQAIRTPEDLAKLSPSCWPVLLEEMIDGIEISVDFLGVDGELHYLGINEEIKRCADLDNEFVEGQHVFPARITEHEGAKAVAYVQECLRALGLTNGPSHTELKLTAGEPVIIETHCRFGGDNITELCSRSRGIDLLSEYVFWATGSVPSVEAQRHLGASICYFDCPPGVITDIIGIHDAKSNPDVVRVEMNKKVGDFIGPIRHSPDRPGYLIVTAETGSRAAEIAKRVASMVQIKTEPV